MAPRRVAPEIRFWRFVDKQPSGCWEWTGSKNRQGYGRFNDGMHFGAAHRFAYRMLVGPFPDHLQTDHLCRNPSCVNPAHLEPVTAKENIRRSHHRNRIKTHCKRGHPFDAANTWIERNGARHCRTCLKLRQRALRRGQKLA
jgi:HNH endonuclease